MANGWGGARASAGRKPLREKFKTVIGRTEKAYADYLEAAAKNLIALAASSERVEEEYAASATLFIDEPLLDEDGQIVQTPAGRVVTKKVLAFPDLPHDAMVLVKRKRITLPPDRESNIYITDRIFGKPVNAIEAELSGPEGGAVPVAFVNALGRVWGDEEEGTVDNGGDNPEPGLAGEDTEQEGDTGS